MQQAVLRRVGEDKSFLGPLAAGVAAGLTSSIVRVPTEVVKTRMQTGQKLTPPCHSSALYLNGRYLSCIYSDHSGLLEKQTFVQAVPGPPARLGWFHGRLLVLVS